MSQTIKSVAVPDEVVMSKLTISDPKISKLQ